MPERRGYKLRPRGSLETFGDGILVGLRLEAAHRAHPVSYTHLTLPTTPYV